MSRAREIGGLWFDVNQNHQKANGQQLELLAAAENISLDDLLDEGLNQGKLIERLRSALGEGVIPYEVLQRRRAARAQAQKQPECRMCEAVGKSTRHHFIPRWLMRELENYAAYAARSKCCIPLCVECHRDLHHRDGELPKSIIPFLTEQEKALGQKMLDDLHEQRPHLFDLIAGGDSNSYEYQLIRDYQLGLFRKPAEIVVSERSLATG